MKIILKFNFSFSVILLLLFFFGCTSVKLRTANTYYEEYAFADAIKNYESVLSKRSNPDATIKLADSYRQTNNSLKAEQWYKQVVNLSESLPIHKLYYAEALMENGKYEDAKIWFSNYLKIVPTDEKAKRMLASCDSVPAFFSDTTQYNITLLPLNQSGISSFSPVFYRSGIVFLSDRSASGKSRLRSEYTGKEFLDLFYTKKTEKGNWIEPELLRGTVNGIYNEGPAVFTKDFNTIYFTRNDYTGITVNKNKKDFNVLKIYKGQFNSGEWNIESEMPFNNNEYSTEHPALSADGNTMYYVSDMPWGYGGTDIYMIKMLNGRWSNPLNIGARVNSAGNETFPFLQNDSTMYFASDGNYGLGGLDIFMTTYNGDHWTEPVNLGYPVNTPKDDFGFIIDSTERYGYFSSNRIDGVDKIFAFTKNPPRISISGLITDKLTSTPLSKTKLKFTLQNGIDTVTTTTPNGKYFFALEQNKIYRMVITKFGYYTYSTALSTMGVRNSHSFNENFQLEKINIGKVSINYKIAFPKNDYKISANCAIALDSVALWMKENPGIIIELSCHTDSRGNDKDNLILSQKRADEAANYLSLHGVSPRRITAKGYGETRLLNGCVNGILCLEEDHRVNNRTEIKITTVE